MTLDEFLTYLAKPGGALASPTISQPVLSEGHVPFESEVNLVPRFPRRGGVVITPEHVRRVQDEIDDEDAHRNGRFACGSTRRAC